MPGQSGTPRRLLAALALLALALLGAASQQEYRPPHTRPGPAADRLLFRAFDVDRAPLDIRDGRMDLYLFNLKTAAARELRSAQGIRLYEAPATTHSILLNPAPAPNGQLNPFSIKEVRQAVQRIVDRDFVANEVYRGAGLPMVTHVSPLDADYLTVYDLARQPSLRYDPDAARDMVEDAMIATGAELVNGKWHYGGRPIVLKFIIRIEDERKDIGDLVRVELEGLGFQVQPSYQQFAPAILAVYSTDPKVHQWHLYTEGWSRSAPQRYDFATINSMAAPWLGNMPGWQATGFWQYQHPELDELGQRIFTGDYASLEERNQLYHRMTAIALEESVRIWVATALNAFPASDDLRGVTEDLVAGPRSVWTLREAHIPGQDDLTVGNLWVWTERTTWNPVGGLTDAYSNDIWRNLHDPPLWNHPFSGVPVPFRAQFQVETAGPAGKLDVPADAVLWDARAGAWRPVGPGQQATSKVVYDYSAYVESVWHHGQPITMADLLYSIAQGYDIVYNPDKARIEFAMATTARPFLETFRGYRVLDEARIEVYVDFWHFEEASIASYATPGGLSMPWELLAAMDRLVFQKRQAAYSDVAAARYNVPWLSLVLDRHARMVRLELRDMLQQGAVPPGVFDVGGGPLVSPADAQARYQAAMDWFDQYGHLVISNGPFLLARYDPPAQYAELHAFRDERYPFKPGDHYYGAPERVRVESVEGTGLPIGREAQFQVSVRGPGALGVRYVLVDAAAGAVVHAGQAQGSRGRFTITIPAEVTGTLEPGLYQLFVAGYSDQVAAIAERQLTLRAGRGGGTVVDIGEVPAPDGGTSLPLIVAALAGAVLVAGGALGWLVLRRRSA